MSHTSRAISGLPGSHRQDALAERLESYDELVELSVFVLRRTCRALCVCLKTQDALAELSLAELIESVES